MKKTLLTLLILLPLALPLALGAQSPKNLFDSARPGAAAVTSGEEGTLFLSLPLALSAHGLEPAEVLRLTPVVVSNREPNLRAAFAPLILMGPKRVILTDRMADARREIPFLTPEPRETVVPARGEVRSYSYEHAFGMEEWMKDASLLLVAESWGCANCKGLRQEMTLSDKIYTEPYKPAFRLAYVTPPVEPVKARAEKHTATFNFKVARHELLRNYKNNAAEFAQVDKVVGDVVRNPDFTLTRLTIDGYASPEGRFESNRALAQRRANSFAAYLEETFGIDPARFAVNGHGEDWIGLEEAVRSSDLPLADRILDIIRTVSNPDARDGRIRALDGGKTYNRLLQELYPPLRRTVYTLAYNIRSFTVEEGREVIKRDPKLLSLNEMYLVANSYPKGSDEFKEVFDIAVRLYPDQPVAILNAAAAEIEAGAYAPAIDRLRKLPEEPAALNNLAVALALSGDLDAARPLLQKAIAAGSPEAAHNLEELEKATN